MIAATRHGRWLDLVRPGLMLLAYEAHSAFLRLALPGLQQFWVFCFQSAEKNEPAAKPCQIETHCWSKVLPPDQFRFRRATDDPRFRSLSSSAIFIPRSKACFFFLA